MKTQPIRRALAVFAVATAAALTLGQPAGAAPASGGKPPPPGVSAQAAQHDRSCDHLSNGTGELCLYYTDFNSSHDDFYYGDSCFSDNYFNSTGAGQGQTVNNNSWSWWNRDFVYTARLYDNCGYTGAYVNLSPGGYGDLASYGFRDRASSLYWY